MKNTLGILLGGIIGIVCLNTFEVFSVSFGYIGGYVTVLIMILTPLISLICDYLINRKSTFLKRFLISISTLLILLGYNYVFRLESVSWEMNMILVNAGLTLLISLILALSLKY